jgi:hypothetical protein
MLRGRGRGSGICSAATTFADKTHNTVEIEKTTCFTRRLFRTIAVFCGHRCAPHIFRGPASANIIEQ